MARAESFRRIYERACQRKGGAAAVASLLPSVADAETLAATGDDRYLSLMTKRVFQAGFAWRVIEQKWSGFEAAFGGFDPAHCAALDADAIEALARDQRIVRNKQKINSVPRNARFVLDVAEAEGSFAAWLAAWPVEDTIGLWRELARRGQRLGGMSGCIFLRMAGKDTFQLTGDVVALLIANEVVTRRPSTRAELAACQQQFNTWAAESGRPLAEISRICALSVGDQRLRADEPPPPFLLDPD